MPVFALEGAAFAGKTTILNKLKASYSNKFITIPEASEFVGGDKHFPNVPFRNLEEAKKSTYFFVEVERCRTKMAKHLYAKHQLPIVMDRSTFISSLFFYQLLGKADMQTKKLSKQIYQHALEVFFNEVEKDNVIIPSKIIYLESKDKKIFDKRLSRGTKNGVFTKWENVSYLNDLYKKLITIHYSNSLNLKLKTNNTQDNLKTNIKLISSYVENLDKNSHNINIFSNFLGNSTKTEPVNSEEKKYKHMMQKARKLVILTNNRIDFSYN